MDTRTLVERVYQTLRIQILKGDYEEGQKFNIDQLARDLGVSNTPVREAMSRLEQIGLVEIIPYCGPKIKRLNVSQLTDLYEVRIALEELAVKLVVQSEDPDVFKGIAEALQMHERAANGNDTRAVLDADRAFHDALVQASGNSVLLEMLPSLSDRTQMLLEINRPPSEVLEDEVILRGLRDHKRIYESLRARDQEAAIQELHRQLIRGKEQLIARMMKREDINSTNGT